MPQNRPFVILYICIEIGQPLKKITLNHCEAILLINNKISLLFLLLINKYDGESDALCVQATDSIKYDHSGNVSPLWSFLGIM